MNETFKIFLSGAMNGLLSSGGDRQTSNTKWRNDFRNYMIWAKENSELYKKVICFSPTDHYSYDDKEYDKEEEVLNYNIWNLKNSDLVVVYFNKIDSLGTAAELALAHFGFGIPVFGIDERQPIVAGDLVLQPHEIDFTVRNCIDKMFKSMDDCVQYITDYYLN